jgi:hypothetical protein
MTCLRPKMLDATIMSSSRANNQAQRSIPARVKPVVDH